MNITPKTHTVADKKYAIVSIPAHVDEHNLHEFHTTVEPLFESDHVYLVFDLGELDFINSKIIGYLENIHRQLSGIEKRLAFVNAAEEVREILEFVGLNKVAPSFDAEEKFVEAMQRGEI
ncbi:MAG: STAS domain-containing protein [Patescibacteria group bacterium]